jgi:hypothetical protein
MSAPPGHSENVSLLQPGTEGVPGSVVVMGGGAKELASQAIRSVRKKISKRAKLRVIRSRKKRDQRGGLQVNPYILGEIETYGKNTPNFNVEITKPILPTVANATNCPAKNTIDVVVASVTAYGESQKKVWNRDGLAQSVKALQDSIVLPTLDSIPPKITDKIIGNLATDRLAYIISSNVTDVVLFPPIEGSFDKFQQCINQYFTAGALLPDLTSKVRVLCCIFAPGFLGTNAGANETLFEYFVQIKKMFVDAGHNMHILTPYSPEYINAAVGVMDSLNLTKAPVYPLLEPTYIIFPYKIELKQDGAALKEVGGLLFTAAVGKESVLPVSDSSMHGLIDTVLQNASIPSVSFKPNVVNDDPGLAAMNIYSVNEFENLPRLYTITKTPTTKTQSSFGKAFLPSDSAYIEDVPLTEVNIGTQTYSLRTSLPDVVNDWTFGLYTDEEVRFLNDLRLSPKLLQKTFGDSWMSDLAQNLVTISRSKCFTDTRLILHADCQRTKAFITKIFSGMLQNSDEIVRLQRREQNARIASMSNIISAQASVMDRSVVIEKRMNLLDINDFTDIIYAIADENGNPRIGLSTTEFTNAMTTFWENYDKTYQRKLSFLTLTTGTNDIRVDPAKGINTITIQPGAFTNGSPTSLNDIMTPIDKKILADILGKDYAIQQDGQNYTFIREPGKGVDIAAFRAVLNNNRPNYRVTDTNGDDPNESTVPNYKKGAYSIRFQVIDKTKTIDAEVYNLQMNDSKVSDQAIILKERERIKDFYEQLVYAKEYLFPQYNFGMPGIGK